MCNPVVQRTTEREQVMLANSEDTQLAVAHNVDPAATNSSERSERRQNTGGIVETGSSSLSSTTEVVTNTLLEGTILQRETDTNQDISEAMKIEVKSQEKKNSENGDSLREYDVLMGRGSGPNRHSGNIHFRAIVAEVFDGFLDKHTRALGSNCDSEMNRIDPTTKNRLAQSVLDKITLEKKGRFLQKLSKKEVQEANDDCGKSKLVKVTTSSTDTGSWSDEEHQESEERSGNFTSYYKIVSEKQVLAKIKQTFRFLRDQNEASFNAERQRQRLRRVVHKGKPVLTRNTLSSSLGHGGFMGNSPLAAYSLLKNSHHFGVHQNRGSQQLSTSNIGSMLESNRYGNISNPLWGMNVPPIGNPSMSLNAFKSQGTIDASNGSADLSAFLTLNRLISPSNMDLSTAFPGSPAMLARAVASKTDGPKNGIDIPTQANNAKKLLEEMALSRLISLQKQREEALNDYLSLGLDNAVSRVTNGAHSSITSAASNAMPVAESQKLQQVLSNLNGSIAANETHTVSQGMASNVSPVGLALTSNNHNNPAYPLSLILQLQNRGIGN